MNMLKIFKNYRLFEIFILGIISGMPLVILFSTLGAWLIEAGISLEVVTTFAIARLPYSLKFFWSPIVDYFKIPILNRIGHRKSWMLLCTLTISIILYIISKIPLNGSLLIWYSLAISLGFFSATFDINFDAFRIELLEKEIQGVGAANAVLGYRIGMLITGAGALEIAHITGSWSETFLVMSIIFALAVVFIFFIKEPIIEREHVQNLTFIINPFKDLLVRDKALIILLAIMFFKLGDAMLGVVSMPFYLQLGFSKHQIAVAVKIFGLIATLMGSYAGGFLIYKIGHFKGMVITGLLQSITNIAFVWLNHQGNDFNALLIALSIENFAGGMGTAALVAYLSILCNKKYSATQYALLSSTTSFFNDSVTIYGGTLVKYFGWDSFFMLTIILGFPSILLFSYLHKKLK